MFYKSVCRLYVLSTTTNITSNGRLFNYPCQSKIECSAPKWMSTPDVPGKANEPWLFRKMQNILQLMFIIFVFEMARIQPHLFEILARCSYKNSLSKLKIQIYWRIMPQIPYKTRWSLIHHQIKHQFLYERLKCFWPPGLDLIMCESLQDYFIYYNHVQTV